MDVRKHWEAKIKDFRFRDLRHSATSYLAMNGASLAEFAEVFGHKTHQVVARHAHLSDEHIVDVGACLNSKVFAGNEKYGQRRLPFSLRLGQALPQQDGGRRGPADEQRHVAEL